MAQSQAGNYVIVDTETTGLNPEWHEVIDVHAIEINNQTLSILREAGGKIKPLEIERMDPKAQIVNGYTEDRWRTAESFEVVMNRVWPLIEGNIWIGSNPYFDTRFLMHGYLKMDNDFRYRHRVLMLYLMKTLDTKNIFAHLKKHIDSLSLDSICEYYDIRGHEAHTARGDCYRVLEALRKW
jgi:DNA polymerase-3 subunit epsilon